MEYKAAENNFEVKKEGNILIVKAKNEGFKVSIYDIKGRLIYEKKVTGKEFEFNMSPIEQGIYILNLLNNKNTYNKIIIN